MTRPSSSSDQHWLMKTEPDEFSFQDFFKNKNLTTSWGGVRNYQARNFFRDEFKLGQQVLIYHSSTEFPGVYGIGEVVKEAYPDPLARDPKSEYFDAGDKDKNLPRWLAVDIRAIARMSRPVLLAEMRNDNKFEGFGLLRKGNRLSIQKVEKTYWKAILDLGKPEKLK